VVFTIDRIKWKMGTSELTTAELTLNGAQAYPVGPLERGLANMVGIVLTYSRLTVGLSGAASMMRAWREAAQYCDFREAFRPWLFEIFGLGWRLDAKSLLHLTPCGLICDLDVNAIAA
jgi:alkylation response protein AidB-like acyl-CoA dehydrogenase